MADMEYDYDLIIVGGGMVGASLACALGGCGLRIAVVEAVPLRAASQPSYDDRSIALAYGSRRIFSAMGLWEGLAASVTPIRKIHVSDRGHFGMLRMDAARHGYDALGYVVENRELGKLFAARLKALDNVDLLCPAELEGLETDTGRACVQIAMEGGKRQLTARLLVGADGGRSQVRELADIGTRRWDYGQCAVIANVTPGRPHRGVAYERFTDSGPLAMLPMSDNRCSLVWTVNQGEEEALLALDDASFLARLQARFGYRLGELRKTGRRSAYPLALVMAESADTPRLALIGNAAHTLHPVAGQGFNLGIRDVAVLAEVIAQARLAGGDIGAARVLRRYNAWRRADQNRVARLTDGLVRLFSATLPPVVVGRNLGLLVLDRMAPAKRLMMRQAMGLAGRLPRLARGLPIPGGEGA